MNKIFIDIARFGSGAIPCEDCEERAAVVGEALCPDCRDNRAEAAYERQQEEGFRGGEAAAYLAEQQDWIQRNLK